MYGVKNLRRRLRKNEIDFSQANALFPRRAEGFEDFIAKERKPRKKRGKAQGGTRFKFTGRGAEGKASVVDRKFGTESIISRRYADKLQGRQSNGS